MAAFLAHQSQQRTHPNDFIKPRETEVNDSVDFRVCGFFPSATTLFFTPLYASTRADGLALKIKPPVATVHFPAKPRLWFPAERAKLQVLCLALRRGGEGSAAAGFSRCRVTSPAGEPPSPRSQPRSAAAAAAPQSLRSPQENRERGGWAGKRRR